MNANDRKTRVLVADDEAHVRALIVAIVESLDAEVVAQAADGAEAVELFERFRPDVAILDINMPRMRGDEALARIRAIDPHAAVIMMTAQDSIDGVHACLDQGARHYILKSNRAEDIHGLLAECWPDCQEHAFAKEAA
jgi:CheY-like chemotaxis protein